MKSFISSYFEMQVKNVPIPNEEAPKAVMPKPEMKPQPLTMYLTRTDL